MAAREHNKVVETPGSGYRLTLLGSAELSLGPQVVRLPTKPTLLLLGVLAMSSGQRILRSEAARIVWPEKSEAAGRASIRTALSTLRRAASGLKLAADSEWLGLEDGALSCDALELLQGTEEGSHFEQQEGLLRLYHGPFMPGFENEWVIDQRLVLRQRASVLAMKAAAHFESQGRIEEALGAASIACEVDPHLAGAVEKLSALLTTMGRPADGLAVLDRYRVRMVRELGLVHTESPTSEGALRQEPVEAAVEWLLAREPEQAIDVLAAMSSAVRVLPVARALSLVERTLAMTSQRTPARAVVLRLATSICMVAGKYGSAQAFSREALKLARSTTQPLVAGAILCDLAFVFGEQGDFKRARWLVQEAKRLTKGTGWAAPLQVQGCITWHEGNLRKGAGEIALAVEQMSQSGPSAELLLGLCNLSWAQTAIGAPEDAVKTLAKANRLAQTHGSNRVAAWLKFIDGELQLALGEPELAREAYASVLQVPLEIVGQSILALAGEGLAEAELSLGNPVQAAMALGHADGVRRWFQHRPSPYEAKRIDAVRAELKSCLRDDDLRAALREGSAAAQERLNSL